MILYQEIEIPYLHLKSYDIENMNNLSYKYNIFLVHNWCQTNHLYLNPRIFFFKCEYLISHIYTTITIRKKNTLPNYSIIDAHNPEYKTT